MHLSDYNRLNYLFLGFIRGLSFPAAVKSQFPVKCSPWVQNQIQVRPVLRCLANNFSTIEDGLQRLKIYLISKSQEENGPSDQVTSLQLHLLETGKGGLAGQDNTGLEPSKTTATTALSLVWRWPSGVHRIVRHGGHS